MQRINIFIFPPNLSIQIDVSHVTLVVENAFRLPLLEVEPAVEPGHLPALQLAHKHVLEARGRQVGTSSTVLSEPDVCKGLA